MTAAEAGVVRRAGSTTDWVKMQLKESGRDGGKATSLKKSGSRAYNVWTVEEEEALRAGVKRYGVGAWELIRRDNDFNVVRQRTGVQLKDKWRNMIKFRKLSETELRNVSARASGPSNRRTVTGRRLLENVNTRALERPRDCEIQSQYDGRSGADNRIEANDGSSFMRQGSLERINLSRHRCYENLSFALSDAERVGVRSLGYRESNQTENNDNNEQRCRKRRLPGEVIKTASNRVPKQMKIDPQLQQENDCARKSLTRTEDRRFGIYDIRRYVHDHNFETRNCGNYKDSNNVVKTKKVDTLTEDCQCEKPECIWGQYEHTNCRDEKCQAKIPDSPQWKNMPTRDQGFNMSNAGFELHKKKRHPRKRRHNMGCWCSWVFPIKYGSNLGANAGNPSQVLWGKEKIVEKEWQYCEGGSGLKTCLEKKSRLDGFAGMGTGGIGPEVHCGIVGIGMLCSQDMGGSDHFSRLIPVALPQPQLQTCLPQVMVQLSHWRDGLPSIIPTSVVPLAVVQKPSQIESMKGEY